MNKIIDKTKYNKILEKLNTKFDIRLLIYIENKFTESTDVELNASKIANELNYSKIAVISMINKLKNLDFIKKSTNKTYRINPFIFLPYNQTDSKLLQEEWNDITNSI